MFQDVPPSSSSFPVRDRSDVDESDSESLYDAALTERDSALLLQNARPSERTSGMVASIDSIRSNIVGVECSGTESNAVEEAADELASLRDDLVAQSHDANTVGNARLGLRQKRVMPRPSVDIAINKYWIHVDGVLSRLYTSLKNVAADGGIGDAWAERLSVWDEEAFIDSFKPSNDEDSSDDMDDFFLPPQQFTPSAVPTRPSYDNPMSDVAKAEKEEKEYRRWLDEALV